MSEILEEIPKSKKFKGGSVTSKITVNSKRFLRACETAYRAINPNSIVPAIANILVQLEDGKLKFTGTNLNQTIVTEIEHNELFVSARFLFPADLGMKLLKSIPDVPVEITHLTFQTTDSVGNPTTADAIEIGYAGNTYRFETFAAKDFVNVPDCSISPVTTFKTEAVSKGIFFCKQSVSEDKDRPSIQGIFFKALGSSLEVVSTNRHILTKYVADLEEEIEAEISFTIPTKPAEIISELTGETIELRITNNGVQFSNETTKVFTLLIDERFPDYNLAIPKSHISECIIPLAPLKASMNRINILANENAKTSLNITDESIEIEIYDSNFNNDASESVAISSLSGPPIKIGINPVYLTKILAKHVSGDITMKLGENNRAILIYPEDEPEVELLIMPVMI
ncbi:DNA polymerase III subunit beta [Dyadobacter sp. Leaf189]|uniref:DNA polymerase III subunit beta n=1 Tax=Dyadobacter sp. Leaf189 TaxID=1736295 RepID=UPI0006FF4B85|nr:DNA polymerase III subunit beta [Dyadobacter sp. Leaf189]KQS33995.1 hypothetical protein ASG33_08165 [Dyadobacter sp. Leaf189]